MQKSKGRIASLLFAAGLAALLLAVPRAGAQTPADWRVEFDAVCGSTDASTSLSAEELASLIARCDKLAEVIGAEEETVRRVYLRRLKMCRDLLAFVLETKGGAAPPTPTKPPAP
jgi:hypothetical protein